MTGDLLGRVWELFEWIGIVRLVQRLLIHMFRQGPIPAHVAFVMDGNRRFAVKNRLSRTVEGHSAGFEGLKQVYIQPTLIYITNVYG